MCPQLSKQHLVFTVTMNLKASFQRTTSTPASETEDQCVSRSEKSLPVANQPCAPARRRHLNDGTFVRMAIGMLLPVILLTAAGITSGLAAAPPPPPPSEEPPAEPAPVPNPFPPSRLGCNLTISRCGYFKNPHITNKFLRCSSTSIMCGKFQSSPTIFELIGNDDAASFVVNPAPTPSTSDYLLFSQDSSSSGQLQHTLIEPREGDRCAQVSFRFGLARFNETERMLSWTDFTDSNIGDPAMCKTRTQIRVDPPWVNTTTLYNLEPRRYMPINQWFWTPICCSTVTPISIIGGGDTFP